MSPNAPAIDGRPVLYVLKRFPRLSETFVLREILGVEAAGVHVLIDSLMAAEPGLVHADLADVRAVVRHLPSHPRTGQAPVWRAHVRVARRHPMRWLLLAITAKRTRLWRRFLQAGMVADRIRHDQARHVHAHFATAAAEVATMAAHLAGVSCSVTAHAKDIHHQDNAAQLARRLDGSAAVITVSAANVEHLQTVLPAMSSRIHLIRNGVRLERAADAAQATTVLCVARLVPKKGVDVLLRATARLVPTHPTLRVDVIGTGPLLDELLSLRRELDLEGTVRFLGPATSEEVGQAMADARVVTLACRIDEFGDRDGMPTVLIEALARAVPVVSTDVPGVAELVRDRVTGLLVPPDDDAALARALHELLTDPELARRLGRAGRELVACEYTPAAATSRLVEVFARPSLSIEHGVPAPERAVDRTLGGVR